MSVLAPGSNRCQPKNTALRRFGGGVSGRRYLAIGRDLHDKVAFLNLVPYHSDGDFHDYELLGELPSSAKVLDWTRKVLFPSAIARKRIVVCLRSCRRWGLEEGQMDDYLFAPQFNRAGHMYHGAMRERVVAAVQRALKAPA